MKLCDFIKFQYDFRINAIVMNNNTYLIEHSFGILAVFKNFFIHKCDIVELFKINQQLRCFLFN